MRTILHVDMDAFFASVEIQAQPHLRGAPLVVGGQPDQRGVVAAASYEARAFGIHSAMNMREAVQRCPQLVIVPPRIDLYRTISHQVMQILRSKSTLVEVVSIDEAYVDMTTSAQSPLKNAEEIQAQIRDALGLSCSIGIGSSKVIAKIASSTHKPYQVFHVLAGEELFFLAPLPVKAIPGVGTRMQQHLNAAGIYLIHHLQQVDLRDMVDQWGAQGYRLYYLCRGVDRRPVMNERGPAKSVGAETTFHQNSDDLAFLEHQLRAQLLKAHTRLMKHKLRTGCVSVKLRFADFSTITRSQSLGRQTQDSSFLWKTALHLFHGAMHPPRSVRLLGVSLEKLGQGYWQPDLFD